MSDGQFVRRVVIVAVIGALIAAAWLLLDLLLLAFASVLLSILLRSIATMLGAPLGVGERWSLLAAVLLIGGVVGCAIWLFGSQLADQLADLRERLPREIERLTELLHHHGLDNILGTTPESALGNVLLRALSWGSTVAGAVALLPIFLFGGIFFAADPQLYRTGLLKLVPRDVQLNVEEVLDDCNVALRQWLGTQLLAMLAVGTLTGLALFLIGVPSPLGLGLIAGLAEFIPFVGPVMAAIPGLLIAASQDWQTFWWALIAYVVVQQLENNLLIPLLASRNTAIPSGLAIFAVVAMGILFGLPGLLLGFPLTVVMMVIVKRLYVHDALGHPVE